VWKLGTSRKELAVTVVPASLEGRFELLGEVLIGQGGEIPLWILVNTDLAVYVSEDVLIGSVKDGKCQLQFDLKGGESEFLQLSVFGIDAAGEGADTFLAFVDQATPIAVVLPEMAHVLRSKAKFEMLEEFHSGFLFEEACAARPIKFVVNFVGLILEGELQ
jgi:hypothetical protein